MLEQGQLNKIKEAVEEFFEKMTISVSDIQITEVGEKNDSQTEPSADGKAREVINIEVNLEEPQILIGQGGQTLFEIQRLLGMVLNKKMQNVFYLSLDINDYKKKKVDYLKTMAKDLADQVTENKVEKILPPMSSYERRIIHAELAQRDDVATESRGDGYDRHIVIRPK